MSFLDAPPGSRRPLYVFLILTLAVGAGASLFTTPQIPTWYASLNHPSITPPNYLFAPVWTTLYILMAIAAWLVWKKTGTRSVETAAFTLQLLLNFGWSLMFFALHSISGALVEIIALDLAILTTTILFFRRDRIAGFLFLPYLGWTAFWRLN